MRHIYWHLTDSPYLVVDTDNTDVTQYGSTIGRFLFAQPDRRSLKIRAGLKNVRIHHLELTSVHNSVGIQIQRGVTDCLIENVSFCCADAGITISV